MQQMQWIGWEVGIILADFLFIAFIYKILGGFTKYDSHGT